MHVVVQFYPWFKLYFVKLSLTHYHSNGNGNGNGNIIGNGNSIIINIGYT